MKKFTALLISAMLLFSLCACGGNGGGEKTSSTSSAPSAKEISLSSVMEKIASSVTLPDDMYDIEAEEQFCQRYGIDMSDIKSFAAKINGSGIQCDEIIMVEAADSDAAGRIKSHLEERLDDVKNQMNNYLPEQYKIASACAVETYENYVTLFISGDAKMMKDIFSAEF